MTPQPNQIYRHHKHDPAAGKWHEYVVVCIVEAGRRDGPFEYFTAIHVESGEWHDIPNDGGKVQAFPALDVPHVCYKNTAKLNKENSGNCWLRPLDEFMDGRFTLMKED